MLAEFWDTFVAILTNNRPGYLLPVIVGLAISVAVLWRLGGRLWAIIYVMMIPFLNWSFGVVPNLQFVGPWVETTDAMFSFIFPADEPNKSGLMLHPLTLVTGLVFVIRDFVQREMRQWVLLAMIMALGWSMYYAWIVIVIASGLAFFVSEFFDWLLIQLGAEPGNTLTLANWIVFVIGKMIGAFVVSDMIRRREDAGKTDPYEDLPAQSSMV